MSSDTGRTARRCLCYVLKAVRGCFVPAADFLHNAPSHLRIFNTHVTCKSVTEARLWSIFFFFFFALQTEEKVSINLQSAKMKLQFL